MFGIEIIKRLIDSQDENKLIYQIIQSLNKETSFIIFYNINYFKENQFDFKKIDTGMNMQQKKINKKIPPKLNLNAIKIAPPKYLEDPQDSQMYQKSTTSTEVLQPVKSSFQNSDKFYQKYQLNEKLGEGMSAVVYRCTKKNQTGSYAVKITKCEIEEITTMKKSFNKIKMLDNQNIIKYKSLYIQSSKHRAYLVMELFQHPSLSQIQFKDQDQIQNVCYKILDAISYMHEIGLCHRDIKPDNILYNQKERQIKIIDFGISRQFRDGKLKKQMMTCTGTLFYKAPQLFKGSFYDQLVDQWAAGITIYKLLTGVTPFQSQFVRQTIDNIQKRQLTFSEPIWSKYPKQQLGIVKQLIIDLLSPRQTRLEARQAKNSLWFKGHQEIHHTLGFKIVPNKEDLNLNYSSNKISKKKSSLQANLKQFFCEKKEQSEEYDSDKDK